MFETGRSPATIVQQRGLAQVSDTGALEAFCDQAIAANPGPVRTSARADRRAHFLKGQVMSSAEARPTPPSSAKFSSASSVAEAPAGFTLTLRIPAEPLGLGRCEPWFPPTEGLLLALDADGPEPVSLRAT